jgi:hypothetical protein
MTPSQADIDDAGAWIAGRLSSMLEHLPPDDPCYEPVSVNVAAQKNRRLRELKGPRDGEVTRATTPLLLAWWAYD